MKLYYTPGACSLSPTSCCAKPAWPSSACSASTKTHKLPDGTDYYTINPLGYVPLLELDDGQRLTEGPAIVQYIADQVPDEEARRRPTARMERYRLHGVAELHQHRDCTRASRRCSTRPCPKKPRPRARDTAAGRACNWVDEQLAGKQYLMGDALHAWPTPTCSPWPTGRRASAWTSPAWRNLGAFMARVARPPGRAGRDEGRRPAQVDCCMRRTACLFLLLAASAAGANTPRRRATTTQ